MERPDDQEPLSVLDPVIDDEGLQGARLGINDNNATAQFLGQEFVFHEAVVAQGDDVGGALESLIEQGVEWIVSGLPAAALNEVMAHPARGGRVVFNAWAPDDELRGEACHPELYHHPEPAHAGRRPGPVPRLQAVGPLGAGLRQHRRGSYPGRRAARLGRALRPSRRGRQDVAPRPHGTPR